MSHRCFWGSGDKTCHRICSQRPPEQQNMWLWPARSRIRWMQMKQYGIDLLVNRVVLPASRLLNPDLTPFCLRKETILGAGFGDFRR